VYVNTATTALPEAVVDGPGALRLRIMPNPARETVRLDFQQPASGKIAITINDALGRTVQTFEGDQEEGPYFLDLDVRDLPRGTYYVRVAFGPMSDTRTLVLE
jgi:hypothetical protein